MDTGGNPQPDKGPVVSVVLGRDRPHETAWLQFSVLVGFAFLFGAPQPTSVQHTVPPIIRHVWAGALLASGILGLITTYTPITERYIKQRLSLHLQTNLKLEQAAMYLNTLALAIACTSQFIYAGWVALFSGGMAACLAVANLRRAWKISSDLRAIKTALNKAGG